MNTVGDILKLHQYGKESMLRSGSIMLIYEHFVLRMGKLVESAYISLCLNEADRQKIFRKDNLLPDLNTIGQKLKEIDQSTPLPPCTQAWYYCVIGVLLAENCDDENTLLQWSTASALINAGLLSSDKIKRH